MASASCWWTTRWALVHLGEEMLAALGYEAAGYTSSVEALAGVRRRAATIRCGCFRTKRCRNCRARRWRSRFERFAPISPIVLMSGYVRPPTSPLSLVSPRSTSLLAKTAGLARHCQGARQSVLRNSLPRPRQAPGGRCSLCCQMLFQALKTYVQPYARQCQRHHGGQQCAGSPPAEDDS